MSTRTLDLTGHRYGKLTIVKRYVGPINYSSPAWECTCECGKPAIVLGNNLRRKIKPTQSCGCLQKEAVSNATITHGLRNSPEYAIWAMMKDRCYNEKHPHYKDYGGRGITVCETWRESFEAFYDDIGPRPSRELMLERRNNDGNYEPNNCYWATSSEQNNNRRTTIFHTHNGISKTLRGWCNELNLNYHAVYMKMKRTGKSFSEVIKR